MLQRLFHRIPTLFAGDEGIAERRGECDEQHAGNEGDDAVPAVMAPE